MQSSYFVMFFVTVLGNELSVAPHHDQKPDVALKSRPLEEHKAYFKQQNEDGVLQIYEVSKVLIPDPYSYMYKLEWDGNKYIMTAMGAFLLSKGPWLMYTETEGHISVHKVSRYNKVIVAKNGNTFKISEQSGWFEANTPGSINNFLSKFAYHIPASLTIPEIFAVKSYPNYKRIFSLHKVINYQSQQYEWRVFHKLEKSAREFLLTVPLKGETKYEYVTLDATLNVYAVSKDGTMTTYEIREVIEEMSDPEYVLQHTEKGNFKLLPRSEEPVTPLMHVGSNLPLYYFQDCGNETYDFRQLIRIRERIIGRTMKIVEVPGNYFHFEAFNNLQDLKASTTYIARIENKDYYFFSRSVGKVGLNELAPVRHFVDQDGKMTYEKNLESDTDKIKRAHKFWIENVGKNSKQHNYEPETIDTTFSLGRLGRIVHAFSKILS